MNTKSSEKPWRNGAARTLHHQWHSNIFQQHSGYSQTLRYIECQWVIRCESNIKIHWGTNVNISPPSPPVVFRYFIPFLKNFHVYKPSNSLLKCCFPSAVWHYCNLLSVLAPRYSLLTHNHLRSNQLALEKPVKYKSIWAPGRPLNSWIWCIILNFLVMFQWS